MYKYEHNHESIATIAKAFSNACPMATVFVQGRAESMFWPQLVKAPQTGQEMCEADTIAKMFI